jgi:hypothetical protein
VARAKLVQLAQHAGLALKQTYEREGKSLRRRAGGNAHAKRFKRLRRVLKRQLNRLRFFWTRIWGKSVSGNGVEHAEEVECH